LSEEHSQNGRDALTDIYIRQAGELDEPVIEGILLNTIAWLAEDNLKRVWTREQVSWSELSKTYCIEEFYIAFLESAPAGCMALCEVDTFFWPEATGNESLYLHKLAVVRDARKSGVSQALMDFFKAESRRRGMQRVELETNAQNPKQREFYESHGFLLTKEQLMIHPGNREVLHAYYAFILDESFTSGC